MPNGIDLILADHRSVNELFAQFDETGDGDADRPSHRLRSRRTTTPSRRRSIRFAGQAARRRRHDRTVDAWRIPLVKKQIDLIGTLEGPPLISAFEELRRLVDTHVADEQDHILPALAEVATSQQLDELGARILQAKQRGG